MVFKIPCSSITPGKLPGFAGSTIRFFHHHFLAVGRGGGRASGKEHGGKFDGDLIHNFSRIEFPMLVTVRGTK
jgi:hypothetical protein